MHSEAEHGGSVIGPSLVKANIGADRRERTMAGLMGDRTVACTAQVCKRDKTRPQAVGAVRTGVKASPTDGSLHKIIHRFGIEAAVQRSVALADRTKHRPARD